LVGVYHSVNILIHLNNSSLRYNLPTITGTLHADQNTFVHISLSPADCSPTHSTTRVTTYTCYMYCCHNTGNDLQDFKFIVFLNNSVILTRYRLTPWWWSVEIETCRSVFKYFYVF